VDGESATVLVRSEDVPTTVLAIPEIMVGPDLPATVGVRTLRCKQNAEDALVEMTT